MLYTFVLHNLYIQLLWIHREAISVIFTKYCGDHISLELQKELYICCGCMKIGLGIFFLEVINKNNKHVGIFTSVGKYVRGFLDVIDIGNLKMTYHIIKIRLWISDPRVISSVPIFGDIYLYTHAHIYLYTLYFKKLQCLT